MIAGNAFAIGRLNPTRSRLISAGGAVLEEAGADPLGATEAGVDGPLEEDAPQPVGTGR